MLKNKFKKYNDASIDAFLKNEGKSLDDEKPSGDDTSL